MHRFEAEADVRFRLRPFYLVDIMLENGHVPFVNEPAKQTYMWRDVYRRGKLHGLSPNVPAPFPTQTENNDSTYRANRIAFVALKYEWGPRYVQNAFRHWVEGGYPPGERENIERSLTVLEPGVATILAEADSNETKAAMHSETNTARGLGLFGSPTFVVGTEVFWGDDRMEEAVKWARAPWTD